ncbi:hypothetical protein QYE76_038803 [Lolium multiflorum]|uniref:Uncharacterized protein n=1 Tax=Lolium multiflorum TaxID=4521 RepID=A0AAD8WRL6_LOLMU|nr:hypothetical protein QYE76_038803 [Lolium multiflorum]
MPSSRKPKPRGTSNRARLCGAENTREKRALRRAGIRRGNSLPEGEIDAIVTVIELDIISITITIIFIIITASPPLHLVTAVAIWHAECTICPECGVSRYKKGKKAPRKVVWYFPITPRLQRYFADPKQAKLMRWHAEMRKGEDDADDPDKKKKDRMLRHPSDASQWNALNLEYPEFGDDPRNIRLGASTDGVNPFGSQSSTHSTWPVFVWMYNLPPGCA